VTLRHVVTLNAGSSSIRFALYQVEHGQAELLAVDVMEQVAGRHHPEVVPAAASSTM
jgi:acetate kinase